MAFFLRAFENPEGTWTCRQGNHEIDSHPEFEKALSHLHQLALSIEGPVLIIAHRLGGHVEHVMEIEPEG
ncbi:MAG: hypothetical protein QM747_17965 [Nocardioides sp.]